MADEQKTEAPEEKVVETYYDEDEHTESAWRQPGRMLCGVVERAHDEVLKALPVEVTEHLANSHKELIRAGVALAEARMRKCDQTVQRARDLHTET
ncbi:MAG: hypothetical protein PWP23_850 [Candidatus Sumerlaeota bacterium]|nr:hypothetical protein [Candidatus Sumerlaeota bacterium]